MRVRSYDTLDFTLAWARVLTWARGGNLDIPDRLPFEVIYRLYGDVGIRPERTFRSAPVGIVMSSKKSGTSRPFARLAPVDLTLYQALVDRLAPEIEAALPSRDVVMAYRQSLGDDLSAFHGTPSRAAFHRQIAQLFGTADTTWRFAIMTDVSGFFLQVDVDELERRLFEISAQPDVVRDVAGVLRAWQSLGIRGLPQGVRASAPLANAYLLPADRFLAARGVSYVRWMDDWVIAAHGFHEAREIQDEMERVLYENGLTLSAEKTKILRGQTAIDENEGAKERLARMKRSQLQALEDMLAEAADLTDYPLEVEDLPDMGELDLGVTMATLDEQYAALDEDDLPAGFRPLVTELLRDLASLRHAHRLDRIPRLLERAPDLTAVATRYLASVASVAFEEVKSAFVSLLASDRFTREHEKLALCQAILALPNGQASDLAPSFAAWARDDASATVRARALLAWGAQSRSTDFSVADEFWARCDPEWRIYPLVAIQSKVVAGRATRYDDWGRQDGTLFQLALELARHQIGWRKL